MNQDDLVSIIIPTYNAKLYIIETVESCLNQTYLFIEIIIQDDCSNDGTWELLNENYLHHPKIKLFKNTKNLGIGENWNRAYQNAEGNHLIIFNADDILFPHIIEESLTLLRLHSNCDMVINNFIRSFETEKRSLLEQEAKAWEGYTKDIINLSNNKSKRIHWNFTLVKTKSLEKLVTPFGLFYPTQVCDAMLWFEAYQKDLLAWYNPKVGGVYRDHPLGSSKKPFGEFESTLLWMLPIYPKILKLKHPGGAWAILKSATNYTYKCIKHTKKPNFDIYKNLLIYGW